MTRRGMLAVAGAAAIAPRSGRAQAAGQGAAFRAVATRVGIADGTRPQSGTGWATSRIHHVLAAGPVTAMRGVFANWLVMPSSGDVTSANAIAVRASIEMPTGTLLPLRFSGDRDVMIGPGETAVSDPVPLAMAAGTLFCTRTSVWAPGGGSFWPTNIRLAGGQSVDGFAIASPGTDLTTAGFIGNTGSAVAAFGPSAILGDASSRRATVAIVGDGTALGVGDATGDGTKNHGFIERGLGNRFGFVNLARAGEAPEDFAGSCAYRQALIRLARCSHAIIAYDPGPDLSAEQVMQGFQSVWQALRGAGIAKLFHCTILPSARPGGRHGGATLVSADRDSQAARAAVNAWLRRVPAPLAGVIDAARLVERHGAWRADLGATLTADGMQPDSYAAGVMAAAVAHATTAPGWTASAA